MAREVFLLGIDEDSPSSQIEQALDNWNNKLGYLGVGSLADIRPAIFHPPGKVYAEIEERLLPEVKRDVHELNMLDSWQPPFKNKIQTAACLLGAKAFLLHKQGVERTYVYHEHHILIAQQQFSEEFLRHNPSGLFAEVSNQDAKGKYPMITTVIRDVSPANMTHR